MNSLPAGLHIGVIAKRANTVDYSLDSDDIRAGEGRLIQGIVGNGSTKILMLNQMHGDAILSIEAPPAEEFYIAGDADGLITPLQNVCLVIRSADCVPVFAYDRAQGVLGAAHSGWRGSRLSVARKLVREMKERYGSEYSEVLIFILPSIGPESYAVRRDVAGLFPSDISQKDGILYLNLWRNIERSLREEGIPAGNILNSGVCTLKNKTEFFSYRGGDTGRNLNYGGFISSP